MIDDLFTDDPIYGVRAGRYRFPAPPGEAESSNGWMRMTNLASAFSDQERLQLWLTWKAMMGLRESDGLIMDEWSAERLDHLSDAEQNALANLYAERARQAARADAAARRGTARHAMMDHYFTHGARYGTRSMLIQLEQMVALLDKLDYEFVPGSAERKFWHPIAGGTMGTSDGRIMCRRTGQRGIIDWKTQARFWTFQEIGAQLHGYDSAPWTWEGPYDDSGRWVKAEPNDLAGRPGTKLAGVRVALVAHMPLNGPAAVKQVDLSYGRRVLACAANNIKLRSIGRAQSDARCPAEDLLPPAS